MLRFLARLVELRERLGLTTGRGHSEQWSGRILGKDDGAVQTPGAVPSTLGVANGLRSTAGKLDLLELPVAEEADITAVRRPEGHPGVFGAGEVSNRHRAEGADSQQTPTLQTAIGKSDSFAIRRNNRKIKRPEGH